MIGLSEREELELKYYFMHECIRYESDGEYEDLSVSQLEGLWWDYQEDYPEGNHLPTDTLRFQTQGGNASR